MSSCWLSLSNPEVVIIPADLSREKDAYMIAGNYLQTLDWHSQPEIAKTIEKFYVKAKAYESLVAFSIVHAQAEIDEYR